MSVDESLGNLKGAIEAPVTIPTSPMAFGMLFNFSEHLL